MIPPLPFGNSSALQPLLSLSPPNTHSAPWPVISIQHRKSNTALDRNDLELLRDMMTEVSREVCGDLIKESEIRMMAYSESHVEKKIDTLAAGLLATNEHIGRLTEHMNVSY